MTVTQATEFEPFFRAEFARLVTAVAALTGSREVAKEIAQESMLRAYRDWARVSTMDIPEAWVRRVAINLAIDRSRRNHRERAALDRLSVDTVSEPDADAASPVWVAVRRLPERQRAVVVLRYVFDQSVADIAATLQIAEGTVTATLVNARRTLSRYLHGTEVD